MKIKINIIDKPIFIGKIYKGLSVLNVPENTIMKSYNIHDLNFNTMIKRLNINDTKHTFISVGSKSNFWGFNLETYTFKVVSLPN